jgi:predicted permease
MIHELRIAIRNLIRVPGFALAFVLTLGLGIGANTAIFSVINGVLLRPLPYPEADRIMHLRQPQVAAGVEDSSFSFPEVAHYRSQSKTIDQFVEFGDWTFNVLGRGEPHRATGGLVTANFFPMLGAQPLLGRMLVPADEAKGAPPVAVLTYAYWQRMFGSDPAVVGQTLDLTVKQALIVGVLKPGSHYASQRKQDFYANYAANDHYMGSSMQNEWPHRMTTVYARLAPGATPASAQAELRQIAASLHQDHPEAYPKSRGFDILVAPWKDELTAKAKPTLITLLVTTIFVLVIACANVANLTLTRLVQREREMGIRAALGAPAAMLRRQLLAENLVLSALGGALGLGLAVAGLNLLIAYTSRFTSRTGEIALDTRVLAFTLVVATTMAMLFAWAPRLTFMNDPVGAMSAGGGRTTGTRGRRRAQRALVISQLAASFMLLIGAGLLTRSLLRLYAVDPGFNLENVLSLQAPANFQQANPGVNAQRAAQFGVDVIERVKGEASVKNAAMASAAPLAGSVPQQREFRIDGADVDALGSGPRTVTRVVSGSYFETIGTPLKKGRTFQPTDTRTSPPVVMLSESMAKYYFKTGDAIGRRISWKLTNGITGAVSWTPPAEIVGVVADSHDVSAGHAGVYAVDAARQDVRRARWPDAARDRDHSTARSEPADRSRPDARGNPRRDNRPAAAQRHADRPVRGARARDCHGRRRRRARVFCQPADQRARHPHGARRGAGHDSANDSRRRRRHGAGRPHGRRCGSDPVVAAAQGAALRRRAGGSADHRAVGGPARGRRARRVMDSGATRHRRRSAHRAAQRMNCSRLHAGS